MSAVLSRIFTIISLSCLLHRALAQPAPPLGARFVTEARTAGAFPLVAEGRAAPFYASEAEWPGVLRALRDVQADLLQVTGREPLLLTDAPAATRQPVVLVGTLGHSPLIDQLVRRGKLDAGPLRGKREQFLIRAVDQPLPGLARALVVAGADQRGTIYGLYELAGQAGVSPWHWWADAPVQPRRTLYVAAGSHTLGEPAVQTRSVVLGADAPTLARWLRAHYGPQAQPAYERLAELLLRLRANHVALAAPLADPATLAALDAYGLPATVAPDPATNPAAPLPPGLRDAWAQLRATSPPTLQLSAGSLRQQQLYLSFCLAYAWQPEAFASADALPAYAQRWAAQQFGAAAAPTVAHLLLATELPLPTSAPAATLRPAVADARALQARAEAYGRPLPAADQAAYFELVLYPLASRATLGELAYVAARQREAQAQGHAERAAEQAAQSQQLLAQAEALRSRYHGLLGGKWSPVLPAPASALPALAPAAGASAALPAAAQ